MLESLSRSIGFKGKRLVLVEMVAVMESRRAWMWAFGVIKRGLSSSAPATAAADASELVKIKTRRQKKTLFEVARFLPNWGVGYKFLKTHWDLNVYYQITRINLYKDGNHGKAWGIYHKKGIPKPEAPQKIGGANKRVWRYIDDLHDNTA